MIDSINCLVIEIILLLINKNKIITQKHYSKLININLFKQFILIYIYIQCNINIYVSIEC